MLRYGKVVLRQKVVEDAEQDYDWQSNEELAGLDAVKPLKVPFQVYLEEYKSILSYPSSRRFQLAVEAEDGTHIGNCACYNIDYKKGEAEVGIMIGRREYRDRGYGSDAMTALVDYIFSETELKLLYLKTLDYNFRAQQCFKKCGFSPDGRGESGKHSFLMMSLKRKNWARHRHTARLAERQATEE